MQLESSSRGMLQRLSHTTVWSALALGFHSMVLQLVLLLMLCTDTSFMLQVLKQSGNLLLLDEPTNDLDVDTLRALETAIDSFAGSSMIISHDRWFLDRLATHILAFEGDSEVVWFEGSYSEYAEDRQKRLGKVEPTRIKFRKLATV